MERTGGKLLHLESLRGLAALLVVFTHFAGSFFPATTEGGRWMQHTKFDLWLYATPLQVFVNGNFAVCVFFVLSGFVLTRAYFATGRRHILVNATLKRYFRLMPPVAVSVLLAYAAMRWGWLTNEALAQITGSDGIGRMWQFSPSLQSALSQGLYGAFVSGTTGSSAYNPVLWTMKYEFLGSFLVFGYAAIFGGHARRWWAYALLVVFTWPTYYLGFALGLIMADLSVQPRALTTLRGWTSKSWLGLVIIGLLLGGYPSSGSTAETWYRAFPLLLVNGVEAIAVWHTLGAACLVAAVLGWQRLGRALQWRPLAALGKLSFGLYLTHLLIIGSLSSYLFQSLILTHSYKLSFFITLAVSLVVVFLVADVYTRFIDGPAVTLANRLVRRRTTGQAPGPHLLPAARYGTMRSEEGTF